MRRRLVLPREAPGAAYTISFRERGRPGKFQYILPNGGLQSGWRGCRPLSLSEAEGAAKRLIAEGKAMRKSYSVRIVQMYR